MAKYITYASHKATNITGLENIPEHWEIKQVRYLLLDGQDGIKIGPFGSALKLEDMVEAGYKVYGQENVIKKDFSLGKRWISENKFNAMQVYRVHSGDILITMMGTSGKCEIVPDDHQTGIIDSHLIRLGLQKDKMLPKFFKVLIDGTLEIEYQVKIQGKGSIMHGLNSSIIKSLELPIPPLSEQKDILNFLNFEIAQIDTLIEKQQTLIQLLKEKRQAVISHAVTKGLNPDAPMKDSGVEWLGEVPEHWSITRIKYVAELTPSKSGILSRLEERCSFIPMEKLKLDTLVLDETRQIKDVYQGYTYFEDGDVLIAKVTPCFENQNMAIAANLVNSIGFGSSEIYVLRAEAEVLNQFLLYRLQESVFMQLGAGAMTGAGGLRRVPSDFLNNFQFSLPPISEQQEIVEHIEKMKNKFNDLIDNAEQAIQLMQERRTALISAAVTGKIDVRGWRAPE